MSSILKATIENETTFVTTHFKKLATGNNVLNVSVIVRSNCHILQFFTSNVQCVRFVAGRRTLKMCCYRSGLVFYYALKTLDISQGKVATQLRCCGIFNNSIITNFLLILRVK